MSLKFSRTVSDYIPWDQATDLILKLERDNRPKWAILIAIGIYTGLRIGDILKLTWEQFDLPVLEVNEGKTGKFRKITVAEPLKDILKRNKPEGSTGKVINYKPAWIGQQMKLFKKDYDLKGRISCHSLRKTFGRHVFELNGNSDKALILLSELFNHSGPSVTRRYLGLREQELQDVYSQL